MKHRLILSLLVAAFSTALVGQKLAVSDSILSELHSVKVSVDATLNDSFFFKVVYPDDYDAEKTYPVLLGLSGGDQKEVIVNYCYAAWFKSKYFNHYITILPVNDSGENLLYYSPDDIQNMFIAIKNNFNVTEKNWIIVGTSNGGAATFNFLSKEPALFEGGIVIPGIIEDSVTVNNSWNDLKIILAYGDKESEDWIEGAENTKNTLAKYVQSVETIVLTGQGHILSLDFDIDLVYERYFEPSASASQN